MLSEPQQDPSLSNHPDPKMDSMHTMIYEIKVEGHLGHQWADWFGGVTIKLEASGTTLLTGPVIDQAALYGLLKKVRDLGIPLVSVNRVQPGQADTSDVTQSKGTEEQNIEEQIAENIVEHKSRTPDAVETKTAEKPARLLST